MKKLSKLETNFLSLTQSITEKPTTTILNGELLSTFLYEREEGRMSTLTASVQYCNKKHSQCSKIRKRS